MKNTLLAVRFTALPLAFILSGVVSASTVSPNATFTFTNFGNGSVSSAGGTGLSGATSVTIPTPDGTFPTGTVYEIVNSIPCTYQGTVNDFSAGLGQCSSEGAGLTPLGPFQSVSFDSYTFDMTFHSLPTMHFTTELADRFKFVATGGVVSTSSVGQTTFLNLYYAGTFSDSGGNYTDADASVSFAFTQSGGSTGAIAYSGTFATPPLPEIPEPITLAFTGSGLVAFGFLLRRVNRARK
jgi:hypothetical protein